VRATSENKNAYERHFLARTLTALNYLSIDLYINASIHLGLTLWANHIIIISMFTYRYACAHNLWSQ